MWRDEAAAVNVATSASLGELWDGLRFEIMPALVPVILRAWTAAPWGAGDTALRCLGLIIGIGILASVAWSLYEVNRRLPLISLAILGLSPAVLIWGDSIRPYGLSMLLTAISFGVFWKALQTGAARWYAAAVAIGILSVQCSYFNIFLLFSIIVAAIVTAWSGGKLKQALYFALAGAAAAATMIPYLGRIESTRQWIKLVQLHVSVGHLLTRLWAALGPDGPVMVILLVFVVVYGVRMLIRGSAGQLAPEQRSAAIFAGVTLAVAFVGYMAWLMACQYDTYAWHYIPLIAAGTVCLDVLLNALLTKSIMDVLKIAVALAVVGMAGAGAVQAAGLRMTIMDLAAEKLVAQAGPQDLIVVSPWHYSISFRRYFHGPQQVIVVPPMETVPVHRYDIVKRRILDKNTMEPEWLRIADHLARGGRVWIVGNLRLPRNLTMPVRPLSPEQSGRWHEYPFLKYWWERTAFAVETQAVAANLVTIAPGSTVSSFETAILITANGPPQPARKDAPSGDAPETNP